MHMRTVYNRNRTQSVVMSDVKVRKRIEGLYMYMCDDVCGV